MGTVGFWLALTGLLIAWLLAVCIRVFNLFIGARNACRNARSGIAVALIV